MYKLMLPKLASELLATTKDQMTVELRKAETRIMNRSYLPVWAVTGQTDGLSTALSELNKPGTNLEVVRAALLRHLAELYADQHIVKGLKKVKIDAEVQRRRIRDRGLKTMDNGNHIANG